MTKRYRWYRADWPIPIREVAKKLKERPFSQEGLDGFVLSRIRDDFIEGSYIERLQFVDTVVDPFGASHLYDRVEFRTSAFRISSDGGGLEVLNPPRSIQPLMNRLSEAVDFRVSISPHMVSVLDWATDFQLCMGLIATVDSVQINSLQLAQKIEAKAVIKGDDGVLEACLALAEGRPYNLEKIQLKLPKPYAGAIVLSYNGAASIKADDPNDILISSLRSSLGK